MDIFGGAWTHHAETLSRAWCEEVTSEDTVLIPGDVSWAMRLSEALPDLAFLEALPGKKILLRGNHDYWWSSLAKVKSVLPPSISAIQNDSVLVGDIAVGGTRGWSCPGAQGFTAEDEKIYTRELGRLELSLRSMPQSAEKLVMLHFPPFMGGMQDSGFSALCEAYGVSTVIYGHLHGQAHKYAFEGERNGVMYRLVAGDYLGFRPVCLSQA